MRVDQLSLLLPSCGFARGLEQVGAQHAEKVLTRLREPFAAPFVDRLHSDATQSGDGGIAPKGVDNAGCFGRFCVHGANYQAGLSQMSTGTPDPSVYTLPGMTTLQERLSEAMAGPPKIKQTALAKACGLTLSSVNDWTRGKTRKIEGANLMAAARFLRVSADWLATGKGPMRLNDVTPKTFSYEQLPVQSQPAGLDRATLHEALTLLFYDELHAGDYTPHARTDRLAELYEWVATDGGRLSKERNAAFVQQVGERHQEARGSSGAVDTASRRKGCAGTSEH